MELAVRLLTYKIRRIPLTDFAGVWKLFCSRSVSIHSTLEALHCTYALGINPRLTLTISTCSPCVHLKRLEVTVFGEGAVGIKKPSRLTGVVPFWPLLLHVCHSVCHCTSSRCGRWQPANQGMCTGRSSPRPRPRLRRWITRLRHRTFQSKWDRDKASGGLEAPRLRPHLWW